MRTKNNFNWENKERKHDPYEAKSFGESLDNAMKSTSRETGMSKSIAMGLAHDEQDEKRATEIEQAKKKREEAKRKQLEKQKEKERIRRE